MIDFPASIIEFDSYFLGLTLIFPFSLIKAIDKEIRELYVKVKKVRI